MAMISMNRLPQLLICDDDSMFHLAVKHSLKGKYEFRSAYHTDEALTILKKHPVDVLLLDIQMRSPDEGLKFIPVVREAEKDIAIVISSGITEFNTVREAMRLGAADYIPKDFNPDDLAHTLEQVLDKKKLIQRCNQQNFEVTSNQKGHVLVGKSPQIQNIRKLIERLRNSSVNVVIFGETGTGKEVVARQLRGNLPDGSLAPFIAIDSATIQSSTAESILFGHEKGAFTGAERTTKGIFEEANGGIVYFDEIANMPLDIQAKLLRVLQEKEVTRLGSSKVMQLEFRVISATNRNLEDMVKNQQFKDDLLQRLNVVPLELPPLRDRREDIPALVEHFAAKHCGPNRSLQFTEDALQVLQEYRWPGNIRELGNLIAYLTVMVEGTEVDVADLPPKFRDRACVGVTPASLTTAAMVSGDTSFYERVMQFEKEILTQEYSRNSGNISRLALGLKMDRSHLYTKLREYGLHPKKNA